MFECTLTGLRLLRAAALACCWLWLAPPTLLTPYAAVFIEFWRLDALDVVGNLDVVDSVVGL